MRGNRFPSLALCFLAVDQITKLAVERWVPLEAEQPLWGGAVALTHAHNPGVALGWMGNAGPLVLLASLAAMAWLWAFWTSVSAGGNGLPATFATGLACFLGGSAGNTLDRLRLGCVIDFIGLPNGLIINIADVAIALGALLVCQALWTTPRETPVRVPSVRVLEL